MSRHSRALDILAGKGPAQQAAAARPHAPMVGAVSAGRVDDVAAELRAAGQDPAAYAVLLLAPMAVQPHVVSGGTVLVLQVAVAENVLSMLRSSVLRPDGSPDVKAPEDVFTMIQIRAVLPVAELAPEIQGGVLLTADGLRGDDGAPLPPLTMPPEGAGG